jgi:putative membrane protein
VSVRIRAYLAALIGLAIVVGLVVWVGAGRVMRALEQAGWPGFLSLVGASLLTLLTIGGAWRVLAPPGERNAHYLNFAWGRAVRDGAADVLPFSQIAGVFVGARALILRGVTESFAYASTVVDLTAEMMAQIVFTAIGVAILLMRVSGLKLEDPVVAVPLVIIGLGIAAAAAFIAFQIRGGPLIEKLIGRFLPDAQSRAGALSHEIQRLYATRWRLAASSMLHLLGWLMSAFQIWVVLQFVGRSVPNANLKFIDCVAIEAIVYAAKGAAFMMPNGAGVQEVGYAVIGGLFGLPWETGVALSFLKRGRDLVLGGPAMLAWQWLEGKRLFHRAQRERKAAEGR